MGSAKGLPSPIARLDSDRHTSPAFLSLFDVCVQRGSTQTTMTKADHSNERALSW